MYQNYLRLKSITLNPGKSGVVGSVKALKRLKEADLYLLLQNLFSSSIVQPPAYIDMLIFGVYNSDGPNEVRMLGGILPVTPSTKYLDYKADHFSWGYGGAGPSQFAFALILHFCGAEEAFLYHDCFKWDVLMYTDTQKNLYLDSEDVQAYVAMKKAQQTKFGRLYWKFAAKRKFTDLFYFRFIWPLELKDREPAEPLTLDEYYDGPFLPRPSFDF